jgi:transposase
MSSSLGWIPEQSIVITLALCRASHEHYPLRPATTRPRRGEPGITAHPASFPLWRLPHNGKKINGRKTFGIVDTLGLLMAVVVVAASISDNVGGIAVTERARDRSARFAKLWCDSGFKRTFIEHCRNHHVGVEVVNRIHPSRFKVLPKRWIVERTWSWLMNSRRLQVDYERDPLVTEGFIWAAHSRYLLRRLTQPPIA